MKCTSFEIEVFTKMLEAKFPVGVAEQIVAEAVISDYEFTGSGYLLQITHDDINLENELIYSPVMKGRYDTICIGFHLFTEGNTVTMDCYSWDLSILPKNLRELPIELTVEESLEELVV